MPKIAKKSELSEEWKTFLKEQIRVSNFDFLDKINFLEILPLLTSVLCSLQEPFVGLCYMHSISLLEKENHYLMSMRFIFALLERFLPSLRLVSPSLFVKENPFLSLFASLDGGNQIIEADKTMENRKDYNLFEKEISFDPIPLPYSDRRDSSSQNLNKQFKNMNVSFHQLHANQQKLRDLLSTWIRDALSSSSSSSLQTSSSFKGLPNRRASSNGSISTSNGGGGGGGNMATLNSNINLLEYNALVITNLIKPANNRWFAQLLLQEYLQLEKQSTLKDTKLAMLEERLINSTSTKERNPIIVFIKTSPNYSLVVEFQQLVREAIFSSWMKAFDGYQASILHPRFSSPPSNLFTEIHFSYLLSKLLAPLSPPPARGDDAFIGSFNTFLKEKITSSSSFLIPIVLPVIVQWLSDLEGSHGSSLLSTLKNHLKASDSSLNLVLSLLQKLIFNLKIENVTINTCLDSANSFTTTTTTTTATATNTLFHLRVFKDKFYIEWILGLSRVDYMGDLKKTFCTSSSTTTTTTSSSTTTNSSRLIRPIAIETKDRNIEKIGIQKKLRQWFWWQHPELRDLCQGILKYLQAADHLEVGEVKILLQKVIPHLLPETLSSQTDFVIILLLEQMLLCR